MALSVPYSRRKREQSLYYLMQELDRSLKESGTNTGWSINSSKIALPSPEIALRLAFVHISAAVSVRVRLGYNTIALWLA